MQLVRQMACVLAQMMVWVMQVGSFAVYFDTQTSLCVEHMCVLCRSGEGCVSRVGWLQLCRGTGGGAADRDQRGTGQDEGLCKGHGGETCAPHDQVLVRLGILQSVKAMGAP